MSAAFAGEAPPSMDEIAAAAGVSRAALYGLFGSRSALLEAIGAELEPPVADRILAAAGELVAERGLGGLSLDEVAALNAKLDRLLAQGTTANLDVRETTPAKPVAKTPA